MNLSKGKNSNNVQNALSGLRRIKAVIIWHACAAMIFATNVANKSANKLAAEKLFRDK